MQIEALSASRDPCDEAANEDALVVLPGRAYAVIDGVTDRSGQRFEGMLSGRYAARLAARELEQHLDAAMVAAPMRAVTHLTAAFAAVYDRAGTLEAARADWGLRIACTLALVTTDATTLRIVLVADSGVRLNGTEVVREDKPLDHITSTLRACTWRLAAARVEDSGVREHAARAVARHGTAQPAEGLPPPLTGADLPALHAEALARCRADLPGLPVDVMDKLLAAGIVGGQGPHQNNPASVLGYSCLDGFPVPPPLIRCLERPLAEVQSVELYTDGYFQPGEGVGVAAWEAAFADVERTDPAKVGRYPAPKGSTDQSWADDRTYLAVRFRP